MARNKTAPKPVEPAPEPTLRPKDARPKPIWGVAYLCLGIILFLALLDFSPAQNPGLHSEIAEQNLMGSFGVFAAATLFKLIGRAAWLLPITGYYLSALMFWSLAHRLRMGKAFAIVVGILSASILLAVLETWLYAEGSYATDTFPHGWGGMLGEFLYRGLLREAFGMGPAIVFSITGLGCLYLLVHDVLPGDASLSERLVAWIRGLRAPKAKQEPAIPVPAKGAAAAADPKAVPAAKPGSLRPGGAPPPPPKPGTGAAGAKPAPGAGAAKPPATPPPAGIKLGGGGKPLIEDAEPPIDGDGPGIGAAAASAPPKAAIPAAGLKLSTPAASAPGRGAEGGGLKIVAAEATRKATQPLPERKGDYVFPTLKLLAEPAEAPESVEDDHQATAEVLVRTLGEFGVKVTMGEVHTGPVITRYDISPSAGVRVEKIVSLDKNLAMALGGRSVRILAPVPGKGCVGVEVPNKRPLAVGIREILESEDWVSGKAEIPVALGREVSGKPLIADLVKMPHLLIAGSTGSGKTVCINAIIASLLYRSSPEDLRFVMVDPKIVEMQAYNALPHMLIPVVTDPKRVPGALKYLLNEMERRYQIFAKVGVRNIAGFNAKRAKDAAKEQEALELEASLSPEERAAVNALEVPRDVEIEIPDRLPYIVCIVDELADLMMVAPADVETGIARLAQLARAAGIHLIIATQRPSVNVITGIIKANLPSRIAFKVAAKVDSRTILDAGGADQLIGRGDLLFLPPGSSDLVRAQGAFVSDDEIAGIVEFLKQNGGPQIDEQFQAALEASEEGDGEGEEGGDGHEDDLLPDALEVIRSTKRASTSMLQRRLKIGYNRAARIMEILEDKGIVGPENGAQPREILKDLDTLKL